MKILQLVTKRQFRGAEVFAANLSAELIQLNHQIIFCGLYQNDTNVLEVENCLNIDLVKSKGIGFNFILVKRLVRIIKENKPDIIQCNGSDTLKYMVAASYFISKTPLIYRNISVISEWVDGGIKLELYKRIFRKIDHVTSVGSESIKDLINTLDYPKSRTSVIRRGIPLIDLKGDISKDIRNQFDLKISDKIVMHIGNFSPEKNHFFLLEIFADLISSHPDVKLVLVGAGITFEKIKEKIRELNLQKTVFLTGFRKDIPELLSQADCFALCSLVEGVPGVILEAGSQKKPSISTNVGGVNEVLIDNETGFIINNFDKKEYSKKLIKLVKDRDLNLEMGEKAYKLVLEEFNPYKNAKKFETLYLSLIKEINPLNPETFDKLRVLQLIQKKQYRGAEVFASQLSTHLENSGHTVEMCSIYSGNAKLPFSKEIKTLDRKRSNRGFDFSGWKKLADIIGDLKPHVIQANASDTLKYAVISKFLFRWKTPIVYRNASTSSFYINNSFSRLFNSFLLKRVDRVISVSQATLDDLSQLFPFIKPIGRVIPVGVEEIYLNDQGNKHYPNYGKNILHIGSFTREKNHEGLLRIFKLLIEKKNDSFLHLVGSGPLLQEIKRQVVELEIDRNVIFYTEKKDPREFFHLADILVLPSLVEGLPGVLLEAMAGRLPVIAYNVGGISEVLNKETGFLIQPGEEQDFAEKILETLKEFPKEKLDKAQKLVRISYLNKSISRQFILEYYKLVNSSFPKFS